MKNEVLSSPIRWAGSKKKVLNDMLKLFTVNNNSYIEPFLGSGVVLLNVLNNNENYLHYKNFYVNDINKNVIDFYLLLQTKRDYLIKEMEKIIKKYNKITMCEKEKMYYELRNQFNTIKGDKKAVLFYILMKIGYNGVYRENKKGLFNVPFGKKEKVVFDSEYLIQLSNLIKNVKFYNLSYDAFLDIMKKETIINDSMIYCDPPYIPEDKSISQKQELYTNNDFDHYVFAKNICSIEKANIIISMSKSQLAKKIYSNKFYKKELAEIIRTINPLKCLKSKEVLFSNYKLKK